MPPLRPVKATLHAVLAQVVAALTAGGIDVPARRYVAAGAGSEDVPWDCEQCVVVPVQVRPGQVAGAGPGQAMLTGQRGHGALVRALDLQVQLVRRWPTTGRNGQPPSAGRLGEAGDQLADDLAAVSAALDSCLTEEVVGEGNMATVGAVQAVGPLGDMVAVVGALSVSLMAGLTQEFDEQ